MQESYATLKRRRQALLKRLASVGPFVTGSAVYQMVRCGNPRCKCAHSREERHEKLHLGWKEKGQKDKSLYVPVDLHEEVLEWVENYRTLKELIQEMSELSRKMIGLYAKSKKKKTKKNK